jgi:predicted nucleotidyltransferase
LEQLAPPLPSDDDERVDRSTLPPGFEALEPALRARPEVLEAYLFGSQARGKVHAQSDVDVAVYIDRERVGAPPFGYEAELTAVLMSALRRNDVDVVVLNDAPPLLYGRVLNEGTRIFARDLRAATTRAAQALSRYCDYLPHLAKIEAAHARRIARGNFGR